MSDADVVARLRAFQEQQQRQQRRELLAQLEAEGEIPANLSEMLGTSHGPPTDVLASAPRTPYRRNLLPKDLTELRTKEYTATTNFLFACEASIEVCRDSGVPPTDMEIIAWVQRGLASEIASEWRTYCQTRFTAGIRGATWEDFKTCLRAMNSTPETQRYHTIGKMLRCKQEEGQDIIKFESRFRRLGLELPDPFREDQLVVIMLHQLRDDDRESMQAGAYR